MSSTVKNIKPFLSLVDESFNEKETENYILSLELSEHGFAYTVLDAGRQKYIVLEQFNYKSTTIAAMLEEFENIVKNNKRLKHGYKRVKVNWITKKSTLVPMALFEKEKKGDYLKFNCEINSDELVHLNHLKNIDAVVVYAIPALVADKVKYLFRNAFITHFSSTLLENLYIRYKNQSEVSLIIHMQATHFEIVIFKDKKLLLFNSYKQESTEDFMYYLLASCEQLKINTSELKLMLYGEIEKNSAVYDILKQYIKNISFGERTENYKYSYVMHSLPEHFYFNLLNQDQVDISD
jgi:hypothetical protein